MTVANDVALFARKLMVGSFLCGCDSSYDECMHKL